MAQELQIRLLEAIKLRLNADVPVAVYLSGGIDSSAIAGMVAHLVGEKGEKRRDAEAKERIECFTIAFKGDSDYDESCA